MSNRSLSIILAAAFVTLSSGYASGQALAPNQTLAFGNNKVITLTYTENFDCVDEPNSDLDFNHILAQSDPAEMQVPICQVGTESSIDPAGGKIAKTAHLYVLVPMFSVDNDKDPNNAIACGPGLAPNTLCGPALGTALIKLFGVIPEAFEEKPAVSTQCPGNGSEPGTCTMHASRVDLAPALASLGLIPSPPTANIFVPTPNHSHVVDNGLVNSRAIWWEVRPILVMDQSDWPGADGTSGITSSRKMDDAEAAGRAIETGSHFFLFFSSAVNHHAHMH